MPKLSNFTNSHLKKGSVTIVLSRPFQGKTSFALSALKNGFKEAPGDVFIWTLSDHAHEIASRMISMYSEEDINFIKSSENEDLFYKLKKSINLLSQKPYYIDDESKSFDKFLEKVQSHTSKISVLIIDYLQLIDGKDFDEILYKLKSLAEDKNIKVLLLSQISKNNETIMYKSECLKVCQLKETIPIISLKKKSKNEIIATYIFKNEENNHCFDFNNRTYEIN